MPLLSQRETWIRKIHWRVYFKLVSDTPIYFCKLSLVSCSVLNSHGLLGWDWTWLLVLAAWMFKSTWGKWSQVVTLSPFLLILAKCGLWCADMPFMPQIQWTSEVLRKMQEGQILLSGGQHSVETIESAIYFMLLCFCSVSVQTGRLTNLHAHGWQIEKVFMFWHYVHPSYLTHSSPLCEQLHQIIVFSS